MPSYELNFNFKVNDVNFEDMTNNEAVDFLREVVKDPSQKMTLTIAKCWDPSPTPPSQSLYRNHVGNEPIRPIDPAAWVASTQSNHYDMYNSMTNMTETSSDTFQSSLPEADMNYGHFSRIQLTIHSGRQILKI